MEERLDQRDTVVEQDAGESGGVRYVLRPGTCILCCCHLCNEETEERDSSCLQSLADAGCDTRRA